MMPSHAFEMALGSQHRISVLDTRYTQKPLLSWVNQLSQPPSHLECVELDGAIL